MANKKYILLPTDILALGKPLYRIQAIINFNTVTIGMLGGLVQSGENLSHEGDCWITPQAKALHNSRIRGNAWLMDKAMLRNHAELCDEAMLYDNAQAFNHAKICEDVHVFGNTAVGGNLIVKRYARISNNDELMAHIRSCL